MNRNKCERERRRVWWRRPQCLATLTVAAAILGSVAWSQIHHDPTKLLKQATGCAPRDPAQAERLLERAIVAAGGRFPEAEMALCRLRSERGDWKSALPLFAALDKRACPSVFLNAFGELALKGRRTTAGLDALSEVRRRKVPESMSALDALSCYYREQNQERQVLDCLHEMAELGNGRPDLWWKLLEMLDARQLDSEYLSTLRTALEQRLPSRDKIELQYRLVARLVDRGDAVLAQRELALLVEKEVHSARVKIQQAAIFRLEGNPREALEMLEAALTGTSERLEVVRLRALIHLDLGMHREAAEDFQKSIEAEPFDLVAHFKLAEAYRKLGKLDLARKHQEISDQIRGKRQKINKLYEAVKRQPANRQLCEQLAELHRDLNDARGASLWESRANPIRAPGEKP